MVPASINVDPIIPADAIIIDDDYVLCDTYDEAKQVLTNATCRENDVTQELSDSYIVSQNNGMFWFKLSQLFRIIKRKPQMLKSFTHFAVFREIKT